MRLRFLAAAFLFCLIVWQHTSTIGVSQEASEKNDNNEAVDLKRLLESCRDSQILPENVVVRVVADLWNAVPADEMVRNAEKEQGVNENSRLYENWEFSSGMVHRIVLNRLEDDESVLDYQRVQSIEFDTSELCEQLLLGDLMSIGIGEGKGDPVLFFGTEYELGNRSIEVLVDGETVCWLGESCAFGGFPETDARAFATLYERLAKQARRALEKKMN